MLKNTQQPVGPLLFRRGSRESAQYARAYSIESAKPDPIRHLGNSLTSYFITGSTRSPLVDRIWKLWTPTLRPST